MEKKISNLLKENKMDRIKEAILLLDESNPDWREHISTNDDSSVPDIGQFRKNVAKLLREIKQFVKMHDQQKLDEMKELLHDNNLADNFMRWAETTLVHYRSMEPLRGLEKENLQLCKDFISDAMDYYVVRWGRNYLRHFERYHLPDTEKIQAIITSIEVLSNYYVENSFTDEMIAEDFHEETGMSRKVCRHYAELIDTHYQDIKLNLILGRVNTLMEKIEEIEKST